jgi:hydrophobic/amphiphilic exporter-1 (mainly G- bacteria), HAE1 family
MFSKHFIEHPVLANVIAIVLVLIGAVSVFKLPVAQYPDIVPPTVQVTTRYPGASAQTVIDSVALPIENQVNGVENALYMQSTSASDGTYTLIVTFAIGTDLNFAQVLVQNRVSAALASLPTQVQAQGVTVQKKSTAILEIVTLSSPDGRFDSLFMSNYATINLVNELARLPGVGNVNVFGTGEYAMRIWMDPQKMYVLGLVPQDIVNVVNQQSQQVTAGQIGIPPTPSTQDFQYTVNIQGRLSDPAQFENVVVRAATADGGRGSRRAWGTDLFPELPSERKARHRHCHLPYAVRECAQGRETHQREDGDVVARLPERSFLRNPLQHNDVCRDVNQRGLQDVV